MVHSHRPTLVSLFAGAGGLDIGLEDAGFKTVFANEYAPHACRTLEQNQHLRSGKVNDFDGWFASEMEQRCHSKITPHLRTAMHARALRAASSGETYLRSATISEGDIREVRGQDILQATGLQVGELDLLAGGPPCQPFSRSGKRENVEVSDGRLFMEYIRLVEQLRPRWFLFENVKGLAQTSTLVEYEICKSCTTERVVAFDSRGLEASGEICATCNTNLTRISKNVRGGSLDIIMSEMGRTGYSCESKLLNAADFGAPQSRERLFIVGSRDNERFAWPVQTHARKQQGQFALFTGESHPWVTTRQVLWPNGHWKYGRLGPKAILWVKNVVRPHDEPVTWDLDRIAPTVGAHQSAKLAIAPFGVPEAQLFRQQWHTLGRRQGDTAPVFVEHEYLTDDELLALQTFPNSWYLSGTRMERAFQIGNAVPPILASAMGSALLEASGAASVPRRRAKQHA